MKVFKSRFVAYKFFKDGKRIPGLLTVSQGRLLPEFSEMCGRNRTSSDYIAAWPVSHKPDISSFYEHNPERVKWWKEFKGADKVQRIIVESEYAYY